MFGGSEPRGGLGSCFIWMTTWVGDARGFVVEAFRRTFFLAKKNQRAGDQTCNCRQGKQTPSSNSNQHHIWSSTAAPDGHTQQEKGVFFPLPLPESSLSNRHTLQPPVCFESRRLAKTQSLSVCCWLAHQPFFQTQNQKSSARYEAFSRRGDKIAARQPPRPPPLRDRRRRGRWASAAHQKARDRED